jgi:hypothetical protein
LENTLALFTLGVRIIQSGVLLKASEWAQAGSFQFWLAQLRKLGQFRFSQVDAGRVPNPGTTTSAAQHFHLL